MTDALQRSLSPVAWVHTQDIINPLFKLFASALKSHTTSSEMELAGLVIEIVTQLAASVPTHLLDAVADAVLGVMIRSSELSAAHTRSAGTSVSPRGRHGSNARGGGSLGGDGDGEGGGDGDSSNGSGGDGQGQGMGFDVAIRLSVLFLALSPAKRLELQRSARIRIDRLMSSPHADLRRSAVLVLAVLAPLLQDHELCMLLGRLVADADETVQRTARQWLAFLQHNPTAWKRTSLPSSLLEVCVCGCVCGCMAV